MALSTLAKEQENFLRYAILIVDLSKDALQDLLELHLKNSKIITFKKFLDQNQHEIYHLCYYSKCCQCSILPQNTKRILYPSQLELLFKKYKKLPCHKGPGYNEFCCSYAKDDITTGSIDLTLLRSLLVNNCSELFWFCCLEDQGKTLEEFLNLNKHIIYHLWKSNQTCCQCQVGFIFPCNSPLITDTEWKRIFIPILEPCDRDKKIPSTGTISCCFFAANPIIDIKDINPEIQRHILQHCSQMKKSVDILVEHRNLRFAHVREAKMSDSDFMSCLQDIENHLLRIALVCGKEQQVKQNITDLQCRPLFTCITMLTKYEKILQDKFQDNHTNINAMHIATRKSIPKLVDKSSKIRKIEKQIAVLVNSVAKMRDEVKDLSKLIKEGPKQLQLIEGSKRLQLIEETSVFRENFRQFQSSITTIMQFEGARFATFAEFPHIDIFVTRLAAAGFYYTGKDIVIKCFCCGLTYSSLKRHDSAFEIHKRLSPMCPFLSDERVKHNVGNLIMGGSVDNKSKEEVTNQSAWAATNSENTSSPYDKMPRVKNYNDFASGPSHVNSPTDSRPVADTVASRGIATHNTENNILSNSKIEQAHNLDATLTDIAYHCRCSFFGGGLRNLEPGEQPWTEHDCWYPNCVFVRQIKGEKIINEVQCNGYQHVLQESEELNARSRRPDLTTTGKNQVTNDFNTHPDVFIVKDFGYRESVIKKAFDLLQTEGTKVSIRSLEEENSNLKDQQTCKICLVEPIAIVFLPCGHMAYCANCAPALRRCPICRVFIKGTVKAIMC